MAKQITLEELLELVSVEQNSYGYWRIVDVCGSVHGDVYGTVYGDVCVSVVGTVRGSISGREWQFAETPKDKFERLLKETGNQELIEAFNQLEDK